MNNLAKAAVVFCSVISSSGIAAPQWVKTNWPAGDYALCLASCGNRLYCGTFDSGVVCSENNGATWSAMNSGLTDKSICALGTKDSFIFAGLNSTSLGFRTTGNGVLWSPMPVNSSCGAFSFAVKESFLFAGGSRGEFCYYGVARSPDNGDHWTATATGLPMNLSGYEVRALAVMGSRIFAGLETKGVYVSVNDGQSWSAANTGLGDSGIIALCVMGNTIFAGTRGGGIFRSTDSAAHWTATISALSVKATGTIVSAVGFLFAGTDDGVFQSADTGLTWEKQTSGLPAKKTIWSLHALNGILFAAASDSGVWRLPLDQVATSGRLALLQAESGFRLARVHQSNRTVSIDFSLAQPERVTLTFCSMIGRKIAEIADCGFTGGDHTVTVNASGLAAGCYTVRIRAGAHGIAMRLPLI